MASTQGSSQRARSTGRKWTDREEAFIVICAMDANVTNDWLYRHMPGDNGRTLNSIAGHFADMRLKGKLSRNWRAKTWNTTIPWTIDEDMEILQWVISEYSWIDAPTFVPNSRAGGAVLERRDYLCQDLDLVETVRRIEDRIRMILWEHDGLAGDATPISTRQALLRYREEDSAGMQEIQQAIRDSLSRRAAEEADEILRAVNNLRSLAEEE